MGLDSTGRRRRPIEVLSQHDVAGRGTRRQEDSKERYSAGNAVSQVLPYLSRIPPTVT